MAVISEPFPNNSNTRFTGVPATPGFRIVTDKSPKLEFAGITSNFGHPRAAQFELDNNEEKALSSLIEKFEVNLDDEILV